MKTAAENNRIIESLREKCQEFSRLVSSYQDVHIQITDVSLSIEYLRSQIVLVDDLMN